MAKKGSILINLLKFLTPQKTEAIISYLSDPDKIFEVKMKDLQGVSLLSNKDVEKILLMRDSGTLEKELKLLEKEKIEAIDIFDATYPALLKEISHPPLVLYAKGNVDVLNKFLFAIVGTRIPTLYGISMAEELSYKLSSLGLVIVSGLARGIDTAAHRGAIKTGETVAVLGSGLLNIYPPENKSLAEQIISKGVIISEFPLKQPPLKENFPRRNRIISGLSKGVLIIEAALRSGALITAHHALEQNREVFALPGKADSPLSKGTHLLIKEGAKLVDSIEDIVEELNLKFEEEEENVIKLDSQEKKVFDIISREGIYLEEIIIKSNVEQALINKIILNLQLKGFIKEVKPSCFTRIQQ
jgi:DNA processing protein